MEPVLSLTNAGRGRTTLRRMRSAFHWNWRKTFPGRCVLADPLPLVLRLMAKTLYQEELIPLADVVFVSKDLAKLHGCATAEAFLRQLHAKYDCAARYGVNGHEHTDSLAGR